MKYYFFLLFLVVAIACEPDPKPVKRSISYEVEVTYNDMIVDTLTMGYTTESTTTEYLKPYLSQRRCVRISSITFACDVRTFRVLNQNVK